MSQDNSHESLYRSEGETKIESHEYHGHKITTIGVEHRLDDNGQFPGDSKKEIADVLDNNSGGTLFLEYAIPDLQRHLLLEPAVGIMAKKLWIDNEKLFQWFGEVTRMAGERGMRIAVADPASNSGYALAEFYGLKKWNDREKKIKEEDGNEYKYIKMDGDNTPISNREMNTPNAIDARRLLTARALMKHCISENENAVYISPPAHTLRVDNYIERQCEAEEIKPLTEIKDFKNTGNEKDLSKLKGYLKNPLFNIRTRYYVPLTFPEYYKIEGLVTEGKLDEAKDLNKQVSEKNPSLRGKMISDVLKIVSNEKISEKIRNNGQKFLKKVVSSADAWKWQKSVRNT